MQTLENAKLKALIKLLETESETYGPVLKGALAAAIKENPLQVQSFIEEEFKTARELFTKRLEGDTAFRNGR